MSAKPAFEVYQRQRYHRPHPGRLHGCYPSAVLRIVVAYGRSELGMRDAEMAQELGISRERVRQVRAALSLPRLPYVRVQKPPPKSRPCINACGRRACKGHSECSRCRAARRYAENPAYRERIKKRACEWRRKALLDPEKAARLKAQQRAACQRYQARKRAERAALTGGD